MFKKSKFSKKIMTLIAIIQDNLYTVLTALFIVVVSFQFVRLMFSNSSDFVSSAQYSVPETVSVANLDTPSALLPQIPPNQFESDYLGDEFETPSTSDSSLDVLDSEQTEDVADILVPSVSAVESVEEILPQPKPSPTSKEVEPNSLQAMLIEAANLTDYQSKGDTYTVPIKSTKELLLDNVTSEFGERYNPLQDMPSISFHDAIDIEADLKEEIRSLKDGVVIYVERSNEGYGNSVAVYHGDGLITFYAHLSKIFVANDDTVLSGEVIGEAGDSGIATGVHLHFEVIQNELLLNPKIFIESLNLQ